MTTANLWPSLYWAWIASEVLILIVTRTARSSGNVRDRGSLLLLWPVIFASVAISGWVGDQYPHNFFGGGHWLRVISVVVLAAGLAIRWTAVASLGKSFSANVAIHATQTLYTRGLFRLVRHPSYTGLLIVFAAIGFHTRNWAGLAIVLIPTTAALLYRIHVEEDALTHAFGQQYLDYSRRTKRLIPGIY